MDPHAFLNPKSIELLGLRIKLMMKSREMEKEKQLKKKKTPNTLRGWRNSKARAWASKLAPRSNPFL